jgi:competence protein ComGC
MNKTVTSDKWQVAGAGMLAGRRAVGRPTLITRHSSLFSAFTLIEVLVVVTLLSLIVLALMAVFDSTQSAFRASVTQSGVLEGGRATVDLMATDLRVMAAANNVSNGAVNFYAAMMTNAAPLAQSLVASSQQRTNLLEAIFILTRANTTWTGVGYAVNYASTYPLYPLYRFSMSTNVIFNPRWLFDNFTNTVANAAWTNMSHLMDGVVDLRARAYDPKGGWMTTNIVALSSGQMVTNKNVFYFPPMFGEAGLAMFSNTLPGSVEIQMGVLEDRTLQRAQSLGIAGQSPQSVPAQSNYLAQQSGKVHVFRQRVSIPNADPSAYQ